MDTQHISAIYAALILKGIKTIDDVPIELRDVVLAIINNQ